MKLLGAALVAAAFAVLGASEALRLRRRARLTSELAAGLELLRGEIVSRLAPMPEAAERLARHGPVDEHAVTALAPHRPPGRGGGHLEVSAGDEGVDDLNVAVR